MAESPAFRFELEEGPAQRARMKVVGIGGSSGKTTAKEFVASILGAAFRVAKTERSQNGELGVPRTLERLRPGVDVAVIEIGIDAPGDMARHAEVVAPDVAVLTSIGKANTASTSASVV